jgi:ParB family transcriptional regulator, chromosome partitioning protein
VTNKPNDPRKALGRGLGALLPPRPSAQPAAVQPIAPTNLEPAAVAVAPAPLEVIREVEVIKEVVREVEVVKEVIQEVEVFRDVEVIKEVATGAPRVVSVAEIDPNPLQPRTVFQPERLQELAESIRANGIIQPLVVRPNGARFELIAGERRFRAAQIAGLAEVPVVIQSFANDRLLEVALIENIQREDLNPIEVAQAFDRLNRDHGMTHEQIANRTGKERATVTNMIRLLRLPGPVQVLLAEQKLSMGHARALLGLGQPDQQIELAGKVATSGMSVRQVEKTVAKLTEPVVEFSEETAKTIDPNVKAAIDDLERHLGTRVRIAEQSSKRGRIEIEYYSLEDLDRIYGLLLGDKS